MRADIDNPGRVYKGYWDWIDSGWHRLLVLTPFWGYPWYLYTTYEVPDTGDDETVNL